MPHKIHHAGTNLWAGHGHVFTKACADSFSSKCDRELKASDKVLENDTLP